MKSLFPALVFLLWSSSLKAAEEENLKKDTLETITTLEDIAAVEAFIRFAEVAVIGFFKDLETKQVKDFYKAAKDIDNLAFGVSTNDEVLSKFNITDDTISLFRQVDDRQLNLDITKKDIDASKIMNFITMNALRTVTEYNPATAVGLLNSEVKSHLLLFASKSSEEYKSNLQTFRSAAENFRKKILFVAVDTDTLKNERVLHFFGFKKKDIPAVAIYSYYNDSKFLMSAGEITVKKLEDFCSDYLEGKLQEKAEQKKSSTEEQNQEKTEL